MANGARDGVKLFFKFDKLISQIFKVWGSRLSRKLALAVFATIIIVEAIILVPSYFNFKHDRLERLEISGKNAVLVYVSTHLENLGQHNMPDVMPDHLGGTVVRGLIVYAPDGRKLNQMGELPAIKFSAANANTNAPPDASLIGDSYEVVWRPAHLGMPYIVVARLNASSFAGELRSFLLRILGLVLFISASVCAVTMMFLCKAIIAPILTLRDHLSDAANNPADVEKHFLAINQNNEIGEVFSSFNNMLQHVGSNTKNINASLARLRQSEARARNIFDSSNDAIFLVDIGNNLILDANKKARRMLGYSHAELTEMSVNDIHPDEMALLEQFSENVLLTGNGRSESLSCRAKDGSRIPVEMSASSLETSEGPAMLVIVRDITERLRAEKALRESEERFRAIVNYSPTKIAIRDLDGRYLLLNRKAEELLGVKIEQESGKPIAGLDLNTDDMNFQKIKRDIISNGKTKGREEIYNTLSGDKYFFTVDFPIKDALGNITSIGSIGTDITDRKDSETELLQMKQEADMSNRTKSEFIANISHELRTPLNSIIGFSDLLRQAEYRSLGADVYQEYVTSINTSGQQLLELINDILDISKIEAGKGEVVEGKIDLQQVVEACLVMVKMRARENNIGINFLATDNKIILHGDARKIKQILINLLSNAIKFTDPGGHVTISCVLDKGNGLGLSIEDDGIGMAKEDIPKALERFGQVQSSLGRNYDGTGLGLPMVDALIKLHGGTMDIESTLGVGTKVTVHFPAQRIVSVEGTSDPSGLMAVPG